MLGEQIGELRGKVTGLRVLPTDGSSVKLEVSFQGTSKYLGAEATDLGTYVAASRPDGTLSGEGHGITMTRDGGVVTWKGHGIGRPNGPGLAASWRVTIFFQTSHQKLARLNSIVAVGEYETDENGNNTGKLWEWK